MIYFYLSSLYDFNDSILKASNFFFSLGWICFLYLNSFIFLNFFQYSFATIDPIDSMVIS